MSARIFLSAVLLGTAAMATPAEAAYVINIEQVGNDVVATGSGSVDTSGLTFFGPVGTGTGPLIIPQAAIFGFGGGALPLYQFPDQGPTSWGVGPGASASSVTADVTVGVIGVANFIYLPAGYVSGSPLGTNIAIFANQTFASIGLTPGSYVYRLGASAASDTFTLNIGSPVPEPAGWALMIGGFAMIGAGMRRRIAFNFT
jgi:hypothetical protein